MSPALIEWIGSNLPLFLLLAGAGLTIAEAFAPGAHFMVLGVALLVAGLVGLALPGSLGIVAPLVMAGVVLAAGATTFYVYRQFDFYGGKGTAQTSDSDSLRGRTGTVTERVTPKSGEVKLEDGGFNPYYQARSVDGEIPEGSEVMVVDPGGGNVLEVAAVSGLDEIDRELERERSTDVDDPSGQTVDGSLQDSDDEDTDREFETDPV